METLPRNVILDLLPAYLAGEASEETRTLVEKAAQDDAQIARILRAGTLASATVAQPISAPDDLEMKAVRRMRSSIRRQMLHVALGTAALLLIPFIAMRFSSEVNWSLGDFVAMGTLLFGTGLTFVLISRMSDKTSYRIAVGIAVLAGFLLIWVNLAVGIIGSEDNPANGLYLGVLLVGFIGAAVSQLRPLGMARALFATAGAQFLVPLVALVIWRPTLDAPPGILGVFMLNAFFAALFFVSGLLFRRAASS